MTHRSPAPPGAGFSSNPPPSPRAPGPEVGCTIGVLERNRVVGQRVARVLSCAAGFAPVACEESPAELRAGLSATPLLLACDASDLELALEWAESRYPSLRVLVWTTTPAERVIELALTQPRVVSVLGWPSFSSMPRPWELALAARRVLEPYAAPPRITDLISWGATLRKWQPTTSEHRDLIVAEVARIAEAAGASPRIAERLSEVAHELLMNAMYDAPVDGDGVPLYAHDRRQDLSLREGEVPSFRLATDGNLIALQALDRYGRLRRSSVLQGVRRGLRAARSGVPHEQILDTSSGGAGLGMFKIYSSSTTMIADIEPGQFTAVTSIFDLGINPRELRTMPVSLHTFDRHSP